MTARRAGTFVLMAVALAACKPPRRLAAAVVPDQILEAPPRAAAAAPVAGTAAAAATRADPPPPEPLATPPETSSPQSPSAPHPSASTTTTRSRIGQDHEGLGASPPKLGSSPGALDEPRHEPPLSRPPPGRQRASGATPERAPGGISRGLPSSRYLSPAGLRRLATGAKPADAPDEVPAASAAARADAAAPPETSMPPPSLSGLNADVVDALFSDQIDVGSYRVQIATSADFSRPLLDKTYEFVEDINVPQAFARLHPPPKAGVYWVRLAAVDLLGFQQPYREPRRYLFAPRP